MKNAGQNHKGRVRRGILYNNLVHFFRSRALPRTVDRLKWRTVPAEPSSSLYRHNYSTTLKKPVKTRVLSAHIRIIPH